ncbi:MAG TPA: prepilin peptidase [Candidatus Nanoarchaeia archaeon]|nr:prepilin peptidase [Candidatus Nanoarchaeia archaeon]
MVIIVGLFGLLIGSFINAAVWRLHNKQEHKKADNSVWHGRSVCPDCKHQLAWFDLVPVISWLSLAGKCRYCRKPISVQYPAVELVTAGLFALSYIKLNPVGALGWLDFVFWLYYLTILLVLAVYDLKWYLLPDAVLLPAIVVAIIQLGVHLSVGQPAATVGYSLLAGFLAGGFFYALAAASGGRWMGGGDIKLVFFLGLILGLSRTTLLLVLAFNIAAVVGVLLITVGVKSRRDMLPFGPFLVGAAITAHLYGLQIIAWYLRLSGLNVL